MRVLITGSAGFVGSHLADRYLADGHHVVAADNLITGSLENLKEARQNAAFRYVEADVTGDWAAIAAAVHEHMMGVDLILHFASPASPVDYANHPFETMAVNSVGTEQCARFALKHDARLLFASTSECYGDPREHPQREEYWGNVNPNGPRSCYDEAKRFGEALVFAFLRKRNLDARVIRIFNTYGPRMRRNDGRVVPNFVTQALAGKPLTIFGNGKQTRSFCYVDDLIEGIVRCAASDATRGVVVNLGNPDEREIAEFARVVCEITRMPLSIEYSPMPADDPGRRCPDITRAKALLGWSPQVSLEEGLRRTVEAFSTNAGRAL
ncbi:SDR family oxidoreductase [bacterium]|nr:MAG: SDR family oxidoreductase [bacterium]